MRDFSGKVVVITGAAGGLGKALCRRFSRVGATVVGLDLDAARVEGAALALSCDVRDADSCARAIGEVVAAYGGVDALINNAGISHRSLLRDTDPAVLRRVMDVNFWGSVHCARAALASLIERRGLIVVLSSVAGFGPLVARTAYSASKHALHGFFESLRCELAGTGAEVLMVCPSFLDTGMDARVLGPDGSPTKKAKPVIGRLIGPDEAADGIYEAARCGRRLLLPGFMAKVSWWVSRLAPALYERLMTRNLAAELKPVETPLLARADMGPSGLQSL